MSMCGNFFLKQDAQITLVQKQKKFCVYGHRESRQQDQHHLQLPEHFLQQAHGQVLESNRPHLQQHPLKKAEMGFYAITLGFDLSSITKVSITSRSVNQNYLTKFAKVSRRVILHNRKIKITMRGTDPFYLRICEYVGPTPFLENTVLLDGSPVPWDQLVSVPLVTHFSRAYSPVYV